jgi:uncharacterized protein with FMN-binding domain
MMKTAAFFSFIVLSLTMLGCTKSKPAAAYTESPFSPPTDSAPAPSQPVVQIDPRVIIEPNPGPGPYTGAAMGYDGVVEVILDVKDRVIVSAAAAGDRETIGLGTLAIDNMPPVMVEANSIVVDTISGATTTSNAVLEAAAKALGKAGLTDADLR